MLTVFKRVIKETPLLVLISSHKDCGRGWRIEETVGLGAGGGGGRGEEQWRTPAVTMPTPAEVALPEEFIV